MGKPAHTILEGDCREVMATLPEQHFHCCVTSPPYFGLRDYGVDGQIGLEPTPDDFVEAMVTVFRGVWRVLRDDGVAWLNLGDSYAGGGNYRGVNSEETLSAKQRSNGGARGISQSLGATREKMGDCKPKDLLGIPWSVAKALQAPFYSGRITKERDRVWLAAMIDGEGSICGFKHERKDDGRTRTGLHVTITNSSTAILDECERIWPASKYVHQKPRPGHLGALDTFRWVVQGAENKAGLLRELYPYLIAKKKQAMVAYNLILMVQQGKRNGQLPIKEEANAKREQLVSILSALNRQKQVDMPSWLVEPPTLYEPGWYLRDAVIWHKPAPMPGSQRDRCTSSYEFVFQLTKKARYYFDLEAVKEVGTKTNPASWEERKGNGAIGGSFVMGNNQQHGNNCSHDLGVSGTRTPRNVWKIAHEGFNGAHFATFPRELPMRCIKASTSEKGCCPACGAPWVRVVESKTRLRYRPNEYVKRTGADGTGNKINQLREGADTKTVGWEPGCECRVSVHGQVHYPPNPVPCRVLDPFNGAGTTGIAACLLGREYTGIELNPEYAKMARERIARELCPSTARTETDDPAPLFGAN